MIKEIKLSQSGQVTTGKLDKIGFGIEKENKFNTIQFTFVDGFVDGTASLLTDLKDTNGNNVALALTKDEDKYNLLVKEEYLTNEDITFQVQISGTNFNWISQQKTLPIFESLEVGEGTMPTTITNWLANANSVIAGYDENIEDKLADVDDALSDIEDLSEEVTAAEETRVSNETTRQSNETTRIANETSREAYITDLKARVAAGEFKGEKGDKGDDGEKGEKGDKGEPGAIKYRKVETLPTTGEDDTIYLVPKTNPEENDKYDEWQWVDNQWEKWNGKTITADLTDYVKNTDYATNAKGGVVKIGAYNIELDSSGRVRVKTMSYTDYTSASDYTAINKRTLENVLVGKGIIDSNGVDY